MKEKLPTNFKVKLFCVLIAFGMWVYVMEEIDPIMIKTLENVAIDSISNMTEINDKGLTLSHGQNLSVGIDFRGKRSYLLSYINSDIKPKAYVENPKVGENILTLSLPSVNGIEYSFNPRVFFIKLEESIIEERSLEISTTGTPKTDYSVGSVALNKQTVYIEGAKGQVDKVAKITGTINVENASKNFSQKVQLTPVDQSGQLVEGVSIGGSFVVAEISMKKSKEVPIKIVLTNSAGEIISSDYLKAELDTLKITGLPEQIDSISEVKTVKIPVSDFNQFPDRAFDIEPIKGIKLEPSKVLLKVVSENEMEYILEVPKSKVRFLDGNKNEQQLQKLPETLKVKFKSSKDYQGTISEDTIRLYLDDTLEAGVYQAKLAIEYPITNIVIEPSNINLN